MKRSVHIGMNISFKILRILIFYNKLMHIFMCVISYICDYLDLCLGKFKQFEVVRQ